MKFCVAQTRPLRGDIQKNIEEHIRFIDTAVAYQADLIIFPELSLTGYEPTLANALATNQADGKFDIFQNISNKHALTIGVGVQTKSDADVFISLILFQPYKKRQTYSKKYLHIDEKAYFKSGQNFPILKLSAFNIALAICFEISVPAHVETAVKNGVDIYIASVAKSESGVEQAAARLSDIAKKHAIPVMLSNCVGQSDDFVSAGKSSVWNHNGMLLAQLDDVHEGIIIYDVVTQEHLAKTI